jgi:DNA-binding transcriptional MocR family regulator
MDKLLSLQVADKMEHLINRGTYAVGSRLPSLRTIHIEYGVSIGTAMQAYLHLMDKDLVVAREKSGYFVQRAALADRGVPKTMPGAGSERAVKITEKLRQATLSGRSKKYISFFDAVPLPAMLPLKAIGRSLQKATREPLAKYINYESAQGNGRLRTLIAQRSFRWNGALTADDIMITNGALEAIHLCLRAVTNSNDTVMVETPCYYGILQCLELLNLKVIEMPSDSMYGIRVEELDMIAKKHNVKAGIFVSNFNNPNGVALSTDKKRAIAEFANRTRIPIIDDDIYGDLYFGNNRPDNIKAYDTGGWVMLCSSFSKTLVPGYRIGWCAPGRFMEKVKKLKSATNVSTAGIVQYSLVDLLESGTYDKHLRKMRAVLHRQVLQTSRFITDFFPKESRISRPGGGFVLWIELPKSVDAFQFQQLAFANEINFAPGPLFSSSGGYRNYIRISCNNPANGKTETAIRKLGSLISKLSSQNILDVFKQNNV